MKWPPADASGGPRNLEHNRLTRKLYFAIYSAVSTMIVSASRHNIISGHEF